MKCYVKLILLLVNFLLISVLSFGQYTYLKPVKHHEVNLNRKDKFEIGLHYGRAWTIGDTRDFALRGNAFSLDMGINSNNLYFGTEFTISSWQDFKNSNEAGDVNFNEVNFLWLLNAKVFLGDGKVKPYLGAGTDLVTIVLGIIDPEDEDCCDYSHCHHDDDRKYNAWFVPTVGIRWEMGPDVSGNVGFSVNLSDNYDFIRLQLGIVF